MDNNVARGNTPANLPPLEGAGGSTASAALGFSLPDELKTRQASAASATATLRKYMEEADGLLAKQTKAARAFDRELHPKTIGEMLKEAQRVAKPSEDIVVKAWIDAENNRLMSLQERTEFRIPEMPPNPIFETNERLEDLASQFSALQRLSRGMTEALKKQVEINSQLLAESRSGAKWQKLAIWLAVAAIFVSVILSAPFWFGKDGLFPLIS